MIHLPHDLPGRPAQFAQQTPVEPEVNPQPFGNGEDKLTVRNRRANFLAHPQRCLQSPFLMATGTKATSATRKGDEQLVRAFRTAHPGKTLAEIPALQELFDDRANDGPPETVALLVTLFIDRFKPRIKPLDLPAPTYPPL